MTTVPAFQPKQFTGTIQRWAKDPIAWSGLVSVLLHGVFLAIFPMISANGFDRQEQELKDPVNIIELSPAEQQRLPDIAADVQLPTFASAIPPASGTLPSLPGGFLAPPPAATFIPSFTPPPLYSAPDSTYYQQPYNLPPPQPQAQTQPPVERLERPPFDDAPPPSPQPADPQLEQPTPAPENSSEPSQIAAAQDRAREQAQVNAQRMARLTDEFRKRREEIQRAYTFDPNAPVSNDEARPRYEIWSGDLAKVGLTMPTNAEVIPLDLDLPFAARQKITAENLVVSLGIVIGSDGKIVTQPADLNRVLKSSGYDGLDKEALERAIAQTYQVRPQPQKAYIVEVKFKR